MKTFDNRDLQFLLETWGEPHVTLYVPMLDRTIAVTVSEPVFLDREGERLRA